MKGLLIITSLIIFTTFLFAQEQNEVTVPKNVQESLTKLYPNISDVKWSMEGAEEYEAEFMVDDKSVSVVIDDDGEIEETETEIEISQLPQSVSEYLNQNDEISEILKAAKIVDDDDIVIYEIEVMKEGEKCEIFIDGDGQLTRQEYKKEIVEEEEED